MSTIQTVLDPTALFALLARLEKEYRAMLDIARSEYASGVGMREKVEHWDGALGAVLRIKGEL